MTRDQINKLVDKERERQEKIHPFYPPNTFARLSIITEELGEVSQALNDEDYDHAKEELIHTIASCYRMLENWGM